MAPDPLTLVFNNLSPKCCQLLLGFRRPGSDTSNNTQVNPTHRYPTYGSFSVLFVCLQRDGVLATTSALVTLNAPEPPALTASFTLQADPTDLTLFTFLNTSIGASACFWDFGDGSLNEDNNLCSPQHHYSANGIYHIMLTTYASDGRNASSSLESHPGATRTMKQHSRLGNLIYGTWDPPKPKRSHQLCGRDDLAQQSKSVIALISQGYFNDPRAAQHWLDQHHVTKLEDAREFLPKLSRPKTFRQRLIQFFMQFLGEYKEDGLRSEQVRYNVKKKAEQLSGRQRTKLRPADLRQLSSASKSPSAQQTDPPTRPAQRTNDATLHRPHR